MEEQNKIGLKNRIAFKTIVGVVIVILAFSALTCFEGYRSITKLLTEQYGREAERTARSAAAMVDGDDIYRLSQSGGKTSEYMHIWNSMSSLCNSSGSMFIYVIQPDTTDYAHITFLFSTINYRSEFDLYPFGYVRETTNDEYREKYRNMYENGSKYELVIRDKGYIETDKHITVMIPLKGSDGKTKAILCVQRQLDSLYASRRVFVSELLGLMMGMMLFVAIGLIIYLGRTIINPVRSIEAEARRFAHEGPGPQDDNREKLTDTIKSKDEIGSLAVAIDHMEVQIREYVDDIKKITAEKERISAELDLAKRIQEDALPSIFPAYPDRDDFDIYASMTPAKEVGGDFYDLFMVDDSHLAVVIADVSGKGIPAALFMMVSKMMIKNQVMSGSDPASALYSVNNQICKNKNEEMFVTVWLGILDLKTGIMTASNAGHEFPVVKEPDGDFEVLKDKHGFVVGGMEGMKYTNYQIEMKKGSKVFVYTDGLAEAQDVNDQFYGIERVVETLNTEKEGSPQEIIEGMKKVIDEFEEGTPQFDDLTMLCVEYKGHSGFFSISPQNILSDIFGAD